MSQSTREIHTSFFYHSKPFQNQEQLQRYRSLNSTLPEARPSHRPLDRHLWPRIPHCCDAGCSALRSLTQVSRTTCLPVFLDLLSRKPLEDLSSASPLKFPRGSTLPGCLYSETSCELRSFAFRTVGPAGQTTPSMISLGSFKTLPTPSSVLKSPRAMIFKGHALYLLGKVAALG